MYIEGKGIIILVGDPPFILGYEGAGVIEYVGEEQEIVSGSLMFPMPMRSWFQFQLISCCRYRRSRSITNTDDQDEGRSGHWLTSSNDKAKKWVRIMFSFGVH
jgi:threonine dehydrogenase-like Zn-dependent dehydrogenase